MTYFESSPIRCRSGFTFIEIVGVLILVGILVAGVAASLPNSNAALEEDANQLTAHLRYAQVQAQADIYQWRLIFTDASTYELGPIILPGAGFAPQPVPGGSGTQGTLTDGVTVAAGTVIRFDSWGRPMDNSGNLLGANQIVTLTQGGRSQSLTILVETGLIQ